MWNSTSNANTESDNKKQEQYIGAAALEPAASNFSSEFSGNKNDFNIFGNNSNKDQQYDEPLDSGICSGAVTSSIIDSAELDIEPPHIEPNSTKFIIPSTQQQKIVEAEQSILDSGCIVSESIADEEITDDCHNQISHPSSNATDAQASVDAYLMLLEQNVDQNFSEWFCKHTLRGETSADAINNLNQNQQQPRNSNNKQQQSTSGAPQTTNLNPSNAWERFYQQNDDGDTPLHIACAFGEEKIVAALIRMVPHPCLFNIQNDEGQTPLHIAARANQPKIIRMLLISGAEPTIRDCRGNTALHLACDGEMQCVRALMIPVTQSEINEAHRHYGHRDVNNITSSVKCPQLPSDLEIRNYDGERCVHIAAQRGHLEILRILELYGANMNAKEGCSGYTPLHMAILNNNEEVINFLLNECKNLNLEEETYAGRTAYQIADALDKYQMINILKQRGAEPLTPPDSDYDSSDLESDEEKQDIMWLGDHRMLSNFSLMVA